MVNKRELMIEESRKNIFELQKSLIVAIMDYQMKYGSGSVAWNVNINFIDDLKMHMDEPIGYR